MKIIIYTTTPYPYGFAGTNRIHQIAKGLLDNQVNVEIIVSQPTETATNVINKSREGEYDGVSFKYISKSTVRSTNKLICKLYDIICYLKVYFHFLKYGSTANSCIVIGGGTFDFRNFLPYLSKLTKTKIVLEYNEYPFVTATESFFKKVKLFVFYKFTVPLYNGFIVISDALYADLQKSKSSKSFIIKTPVLCGNFDLEIGDETPPYPEPYIIHAGSMRDDKDGILSSLKAFSIAKKKVNNLLYVLAGDLNKSKDKKQIEGLILAQNLSQSVIFVGHKVKDELSYLYRHASMAIINKPHNVQNVYGFNTKISEYTAYKIAMILSKVGENVVYFKNDYNALIVEPNNIEEIAAGIIYLMNNPLKRQELANNAFKLTLKEFNPKYNATILIKHLK